VTVMKRVLLPPFSKSNVYGDLDIGVSHMLVKFCIHKVCLKLYLVMTLHACSLLFKEGKNMVWLGKRWPVPNTKIGRENQRDVYVTSYLSFKGLLIM
jgi:hypothetical protein